MADTESDFMSAHLQQLIGLTVVAVVRDGGHAHTDECHGLLFTDGTIAWVMRDPEGNGPGFLDIQISEKKKGGKKNG